jgi:methyltransferase (TIGR00027 family)
VSSGRPSRTAEYMALFRALETARRPESRLFDDPWARHFLGRRLCPLAHAARLPCLRRLATAAIDRRWPGARASGVARTRLIDDVVRSALARGVGQVVLLGAGFDSRAYRLDGIERARVFEVDRPATLDAKTRRLRRRLGPLPAHVAFVAVDFDADDVGRALQAAGFRDDLPSLFVWEGVTNYLTEPAVAATLRMVGSTAPGTWILFTYVHRRALAPDWKGTLTVAATLRRAGEPWTFGLEPAELRGFLGAHGLMLLEDVGSVEYRRRYLGARGPHLRGYEFYRLALAQVRNTRVPPRPLVAQDAAG